MIHFRLSRLIEGVVVNNGDDDDSLKNSNILKMDILCTFIFTYLFIENRVEHLLRIIPAVMFAMAKSLWQEAGYCDKQFEK